MAHVVEDRVAETSTTTGTGNFSLAGAIVGYRAFDDVMANGDTCYYAIEAVDASGVPTGEWETGLGTFNDTDTLVRTSVRRSSNSNAAVSFATGTKRVLLVWPEQGVGRGTAFPSSPYTGERFVRTDRNIDYFYDGTRWLSTHLHQLRMDYTAGLTADGVNDFAPVPFKGIYDLWLESWQATMLLTAGSATWTWYLRYRDSANAATNVAGVTVTNPTANVWTNGSTTINALLDAAAMVLENSFDETAGAAALHGGAALYYRLVG